LVDEPASRLEVSASESAMLAAELGGEPIADEVPGLGATLVITATRAIVVREGAHFRPRNGVTSWSFGLLRDSQLARPRRGNGRIVLRTGPYPWHAISIFIAAQEWPAAARVVGQIRSGIALARRSPRLSTGSRGGDVASDPPDDDR
jgi:hypothetical protein